MGSYRAIKDIVSSVMITENHSHVWPDHPNFQTPSLSEGTIACESTMEVSREQRMMLALWVSYLGGSGIHESDIRYFNLQRLLDKLYGEIGDDIKSLLRYVPPGTKAATEIKTLLKKLDFEEYVKDARFQHRPGRFR